MPLWLHHLPCVYTAWYHGLTFDRLEGTVETDPDITPEQRERLEQLKSLLGNDSLPGGLSAQEFFAEVRRTHPKAELVVLRDMSICWAFLSTAVSQLEATTKLMPENVSEGLQIPLVLAMLGAIQDSLLAHIDLCDPEDER